MSFRFSLFVSVLLLSHIFPISQAAAAESRSSGGSTMKLASSAFPANGDIPKRFTCDDSDISPPLSWSDVPAGTKSLALIIDDPDAPDPAAPKMTWVHWVVYNLPPDIAGLEEGVATGGLPPAARAGINDWKRPGYGGPCPPIGTHRYHHKLYALDVVLPDLAHPDKAALEKAMQGHVIAKAELIGRYARGR
ncbi:MAG: YbhB YbcL family protein [Proteobacteria bacterium]|nr:YbhB YbcL family protein [Pseudomonadota bacterium]